MHVLRIRLPNSLSVPYLSPRRYCQLYERRQYFLFEQPIPLQAHPKQILGLVHTFIHTIPLSNCSCSHPFKDRNSFTPDISFVLQALALPRILFPREDLHVSLQFSLAMSATQFYSIQVKSILNVLEQAGGRRSEKDTEILASDGNVSAPHLTPHEPPYRRELYRSWSCVTLIEGQAALSCVNPYV